MARHPAAETTTEPWSRPRDNVRETRGRIGSTALFLSRLFFHFFGGVAALSAALLTRSGCGVGLIQLALCVCVFGADSVIENSCKRRETILKTALCGRESGEERNYQNNSLPNLSTVIIPIRQWANCSKSERKNDGGLIDDIHHNFPKTFS